jgi:hypothetical protein
MNSKIDDDYESALFSLVDSWKIGDLTLPDTY